MSDNTIFARQLDQGQRGRLFLINKYISAGGGRLTEEQQRAVTLCDGNALIKCLSTLWARTIIGSAHCHFKNNGGDYATPRRRQTELFLKINDKG